MGCFPEGDETVAEDVMNRLDLFYILLFWLFLYRMF